MKTHVAIQRKPMDYLSIVFKRKWLIIVPIFIATSIGIIAANTLPKIYESSTLVLVEEGKVINPLIQGLAVSTSMAQRLGILREQILGWDRVNQLITELDLAKDVKTQEEFEDLVKELRKKIIVRLKGRNIVGIAFQGRNPREAMNIVRTITDIFIAENVRQQSKETDDAISFINDQLELYRRKLKQADIAVMEEKLNDLLIDSTQKHPMVVDLNRKIDVAKTELEEGNYQIDTSGMSESTSEMAALQEELKGIREELVTSGFGNDEQGANRSKLSGATDEKLYKLLLLDRVDRVTKRDENVNNMLYNELLKRLETAKITQRLEASKDGTRYTLLDPARLPLKPVKPNKPMVLLMSMFLGACCGTGFVFAAEVFDHSFLGVDEAKSFLDLPMLGAISKIVTQGDIRAQRFHTVKMASLTVLTSIGLLVLIIFNVILGS